MAALVQQRNITHKDIINMYKRKTVDEFEIQGNAGDGCGYEMLTTETTRKEAKQRIREYRENAPGSNYRFVCKRVKLAQGSTS
jgi:hypothetical protein